MLIITIIIIVGVGTGYLIRGKNHIVRYIDTVSIIFMFALLTILGLSLGTNKQVINSFKEVGLYAIAISISSIIGSSFIGLILYRLFFKKDKG